MRSNSKVTFLVNAKKGSFSVKCRSSDITDTERFGRDSGRVVIGMVAGNKNELHRGKLHNFQLYRHVCVPYQCAQAAEPELRPVRGLEELYYGKRLFGYSLGLVSLGMRSISLRLR